MNNKKLFSSKDLGGLYILLKVTKAINKTRQGDSRETLDQRTRLNCKGPRLDLFLYLAALPLPEHDPFFPPSHRRTRRQAAVGGKRRGGFRQGEPEPGRGKSPRLQPSPVPFQSLYYDEFRWSLVKSVSFFAFGVYLAREFRGVDLTAQGAPAPQA